MNEHLKDLHMRLKVVIVDSCNKLGCDNCGLSWEEDGRTKCSATDLQNKIDDIEMGEAND